MHRNSDAVVGAGWADRSGLLKEPGFHFVYKKGARCSPLKNYHGFEPAADPVITTVVAFYG